MDWLRRLVRPTAGAAAAEQPSEYVFAVQCAQCGEVIQTRVDLTNDLSPEYGEADAEATFVCRKVVMGPRRCFQQIEVSLTFDADRRLTGRQIVGGNFVEPSPAAAGSGLVRYGSD